MITTLEHDLRELGLWWLPDDRDRQVAGILTYTPTEGARLELIGMLRNAFDGVADGDTQPITSRDFERSGRYGRICGVAGAKAFTLEGCFRIGASNMLTSQAGGSTEQIHVNRFILGAEFEPGESVDATRIDVRLLHLPYWIGEGGLAEKRYFPGKVPEGEPLVVLEAHPTPDRITKLENGMTLSMCEEFTTVGDHVTERGLRRDFQVRLEGDRLDVEKYLEVITTFQDLVSIGTNRTATFEEFRFHHPDIVSERGEEVLSVPIAYYAQWSNWETREPTPPNPHDLLFTLAGLGGVEAIQRWCSVALRHRGALGRVMATRYRSSRFVSDKLLNRAAALEALDRDTHSQDDLSFKQRMLRLAALAGDRFLDAIDDAESWATRFKDARVAAAHHSDRHADDAGHLDYYLAEVAYFLFVCCFLRLIEANDETLGRVTNDRHFTHAAQVLRQEA